METTRSKAQSTRVPACEGDLIFLKGKTFSPSLTKGNPAIGHPQCVMVKGAFARRTFARRTIGFSMGIFNIVPRTKRAAPKGSGPPNYSSRSASSDCPLWWGPSKHSTNLFAKSAAAVSAISISRNSPLVVGVLICTITHFGSAPVRGVGPCLTLPIAVIGPENPTAFAP